MNSVPAISEAEYQVMKIVWESAPINTNEIIAKLEATTSWKPKTIGTLLARLVKKGALRYEKNGRVFVYMPLVDEPAVLDSESDTFLKRFYDGTLNSMVVNYLERDKLSDDDISELKKLLERRLPEGR